MCCGQPIPWLERIFDGYQFETDVCIDSYRTYIHRAKDWVQTSHVDDTPGKNWITPYANDSFSGGLRDSKSTSGCFLDMVGRIAFPTFSLMCKTKEQCLTHPRRVKRFLSMLPNT